MPYSKFGENYLREHGIVRLMEDLGDVSGNTIMLGGGNPAHIEETYRLYSKRIKNIADDVGLYKTCVEKYAPNQGDVKFIANLAEMFRNEFSLDVYPENIALTTGSQSSFFMLFNMFAGEFADGTFKKIMFPLIPEYIGYTSSGLKAGMLQSNRPLMDIDEQARQFKYRINFDTLQLTPNTGAICVSRPTNPSGNVITDDELSRLDRLAKERHIPLIVDNAYGAPFPNIIFTDARLFWNNNIVFCMSLSKLGFPASRTGIVVANREIIKVIATLNAAINLAPPSIVSTIVSESIKTREILTLSNTAIKPHYRGKLRFALHIIHQELVGYDYFTHNPEGAMFVWLWMRDFPITSDELYKRLKNRNVVVVSGMPFFPGCTSDWQHTKECIRISVAVDKGALKKGLTIICDEIKATYDKFRGRV